MQHTFSAASAAVSTWKTVANPGSTQRSGRTRTLVLSAHTNSSSGAGTLAVALVIPQRDEVLYYEEVALTTPAGARRTNFANDGGGYVASLAADVSGNCKVDVGYGSGEDGAEWRLGLPSLTAGSSVTVNWFFDTEV